MTTPAPVPDHAETNPWAAPTAKAGPPEGLGLDASRLDLLAPRRTTVRLVGLGFLMLAPLELFLAFVAGENSRKFWGMMKFRAEQGLGGGSALDTAVVLTTMAALLTALAVVHLVLGTGLWRLARWARVAAIGTTLVSGLSMVLALLIVGDRDGGLGWLAAFGSALIGGAGNGGLALLLLLPASRALFAPGVAAALKTVPRPRRPFGRLARALLAGLLLVILDLVLLAATAVFFFHWLMLIA